MKNQLNKAIQFLKEKKTILYPTDTVWGVGCDATSQIAVKKIYRIKKREESKSLIILVNGFEMLENYIDFIPKKIKTYLKSTTKPITVIYNNPKNLAKNVIAKDNTIAIRIVKNGFAYSLIKAFGKPIVSTSANISGENTPSYFQEISTDIKQNVDCVVSIENENKDILKENSKDALPKHSYKKKQNTRTSLLVKPSKIIRFANDEIEILRD